MSTLRYLAPALAGVLSLGFAAATLAQDVPPPPAAEAGQHADREARRAEWEARRAEHIQKLHDELGVRPDQEAAFQTFTQSMHGDGGHHGHHGMRGPDGQGGEHADLTTPERIDRAERRMGERHDAFERHAEAVKAFYAVLSPDQQHKFDELMRNRMMERGRVRHHGMHHEGDHDRDGDGGRDDRQG